VAAITESVLAGCHDEAIEDVEIVACRALDFTTGSATADDLLGADGYLLGTTANFGYMSGALKHVSTRRSWRSGEASLRTGARRWLAAALPVGRSDCTCTAGMTRRGPSALSWRSRVRWAGARHLVFSR